MINLESIHIEEMRGIRKLDLDFKRQKFAISGPNGSGKSGVIDAIEFGLTGEIGRLTGSGTKGISVAEHGPHVDKTKFPDAAFVELRVFLPELGKSVTITRKVKSPKRPKIEPPDPDIQAALAEIADHPEITLSRRDIMRFILVEPTKRSEEIQSLLKLEGIGQIRSALNTAQNKLQTAARTASAQVSSSKETLRLHLQVPIISAESLLETVNKQRKVLDLSAITKLAANTTLDAGVSDRAKTPDFFNKESALRYLEALTEATKGFAELAKTEVSKVVANLAKLEAVPAVLAVLQRRLFIEKGLDFVDGPECPLCDIQWEDEQRLLEHLRAKLAKSNEAEKLQDSLLRNGTAIAEKVIRVIDLITPVQKLAEKEGESAFSEALNIWKTDLEGLKGKLTAVEGLTTLKDRFAVNWLQTPDALPENLQRLAEKVTAKPDQAAAVNAHTFLTTAQLRLGDCWEVSKKEKTAKHASTSAKAAYDVYCRVLEDELNTLYEEVQEDFSTFYRELNQDDEDKFTAKLTPSEGQLDLKVNFYERGLFPPGAYHSEGHQDGMGVCLYFALMKRLFGDRFTFALLDDVVMSVDSEHRYQFCKLLKEHFPETQFIITTHDRLWAEQMKSAGLVSDKTSVAFNSWSVDTGPLVESNREIWDEIDAALARGKVEVAAASLRHHLEYASRHLADQLGATLPFRADGNYELGELLPYVLTRIKKLYGIAADAAQSWGDEVNKQAVVQRKASLSASAGVSNVERWAVNKAVHYNAWANFGRKDFEPVVAAFKELLAQFHCESCDSWVYVMPKRGDPESLRCGCTVINLNLKVKSK